MQKLQASLDETQRILEQSQNSYTDGTYEGEGAGFGGSIDVKVTIEDGQLKNIEIISAENEDGTYLETLLSNFSSHRTGASATHRRTYT